MQPQPISTEVLIEKYAKNSETSVSEVYRRVARALAQVEPEDQREAREREFLEAQEAGMNGAGRIASAAGTNLAATLINCFVQPVGDAISGVDENGLPGIYPALQESAETMRRGGGVGYNFSYIRPRNAEVGGTASRASGPLSYMRVFDRSCETVESAGARRGAQMGILNVSHPDIQEFIVAKHKEGELTNFNVSVGVSDEFMQAVVNDTEFELVHKAKPCAELISKTGAYQRADGLWVYKKVRAQDIWNAIMRSTFDNAEPGVIFLDRVNRENNLWYVEKLEASNPCGEQILPPYGCCCLGPVNLTRFIVNPFGIGGAPAVQWERLKKMVRTGVRMLDNVLDATVWPLPQQAKEAAAKRRIGLGYTGLGDALIMLTLAYDSEEGRAMARELTKTIALEAYWASVELAKERGAFPLFKAEEYLQSGFTQRLPDDLREAIRTHGIRNSHLLSIAPTGTVSLAFADNASNGVEPPFSWTYTRKKRQADGTTKEYTVEDHAYRKFRLLGGDVQNLPPYFRSAMEIPAQAHVLMVEAVSAYIDAAISKTVNVPEDCPYEAFQGLYLEAWRRGLKGITTYRPNDKRGSVLSVTPAAPAPATAQQPPAIELDDADKRLALRKTIAPVMDSLRWPSRPKLPQGASAWVSDTIEVGSRSFVAVVADVASQPFEVWVTGAKPPRGLSSLAKALSVDMHTADAAWVGRKLDMLRRTNGQEMPMTDPASGQAAVMPSPVAALSRLVQFRYETLGGATPEQPAPSPMLNALIAPREPKTGTDGTMAWVADVNNPVTGDDFVLMMKELQMPDGSTRPYSIWAAGAYPRAFDGLFKVLSLDMRIVDPAWVAMKLRKLLSYAEPQGDFMARVPGSQKQETFPSTEAYVARLVIHRYAMLGILNEDGYPVSEMGVVRAQEVKAEAAAQGLQVQPGDECPECHQHAYIKRDGCKFCTACGHEGGCG